MARRLPFLVVLSRARCSPGVCRTTHRRPCRRRRASCEGAGTPIPRCRPTRTSSRSTIPRLPAMRAASANLPATSNEQTGAAKLDVNSPASQAYLAFLAEKRDEFLQRGPSASAGELEVGYIYDVVLNGLIRQAHARRSRRDRQHRRRREVRRAPAGAPAADRSRSRNGSARPRRGAAPPFVRAGRQLRRGHDHRRRRHRHQHRPSLVRRPCPGRLRLSRTGPTRSTTGGAIRTSRTRRSTSATAS